MRMGSSIRVNVLDVDDLMLDPIRIQYRELELSKKLPGMSENEQLRLLASDGMLVKRPLLVGEDFVLTGFKEAEWAEKLL